MDPVSAVASIIAIYQLASTVSSLCFRYAQGVRGADRGGDLVINEIDTFQRYLRSVKEILVQEDVATEGLHRLQNLNEIINGQSAALKACERHLEDLKLRLLKLESEGRVREAIHKLSWPFKQEEIKITLDTLKKFTEAVDRALNIDNNKIIRDVESATNRIQNSLESAKSREVKEKVLDWLSHPDPSDVHELRRRDRNDRARTCRWFLDGNIFQEFKATPQSVLWFHGDSGCGKSVLCSAVIDEIVALRRRGSRIELAYWYFSMTDKKQTLINTFLRALITQFILEYPMPPFLLDLWKTRKMGREAPKAADLIQTIQEILVAKSSYKHFIVIDALDESDETERAEIMRFLRDLAVLDADIHILTTSRTNAVGVGKGVRDLSSFCSIAMEGQDTDHDIIAHIAERLESDDALSKWSPKIRQSIKETVVRDAGGMFRWVECQLQAVRKCRKPAEVRRTLKTLPKDLHEVYARELAKVDENASTDVLRLLEWVAFPQQQLRIEEAIDLLAVDLESDPPAFDVENRMIDSEEVLKICGSLVRLDTTKGQNDMGVVIENRTLTAAHTSVIDFLTTQPIKIGAEEVCRFSRAKANLRMAETCLIYLRYFPENDITLTKDTISSYPSARLGAVMWNEFYQEVLTSDEKVDMTRLNGLVMELFKFPKATLNWIRLFDPDRAQEGTDFDATISGLKPAIYYAARLGLTEVVKRLIREGYPIDEVVGPPFGTPLVAASAMGRTDVVSLLLDSGANPNLSGYFYHGTPLAAAIGFGRIEVVAILLARKGIDINGVRHPPVKASEEICAWLDEYRYLQERIMDDENGYRKDNCTTRCKVLGTRLIELDENADPRDWGDTYFKNSYVSNDNTNTHLENQLRDVTLSLDKNRADSDDGDMTQYAGFFDRATTASYRVMRSNQSMVYIATNTDNLEVLDMLLTAGADPNIRGGFYGTAMQNACDSGAKGYVVLEKLLRNGASTDVYGGYRGSPLNVASMFGSIQMIESLITAGADVNGHDTWNSSPLYHACVSGRADVVRLLLKHGAETDIHVDENKTPLLFASTKGNTDVVQILLDAGTDINHKGDRKGTALYVACQKQNRKMVKLLLSLGANPNIQQCGTRDHALQEACEHGNEEIIKLLLSNGARTDLYGGHYGSALHAACIYGRESVMRTLLSYRADVNTNDWNSNSPLISACQSGRFQVVKFLVKAGANIHSTNLIGHSAVLATISSTSYHQSRMEALNYLIGLGADLFQKDKRGCNGLHYAARVHNSEILKKMLGHGINVNATDHNGWSSLHWAVASTEDLADVIKLLLEEGCDSRIKDKQGRTALDLAKVFRKTEEIAILNDTTHAYTNSTEVQEFWEDWTVSTVCDGCAVDRNYCRPESWHKCNECIDFDFCFRCILDKDTIHFRDHSFSNERA